MPIDPRSSFPDALPDPLLAQRIQERARDFDLRALFELLASLGKDRAAVRVRSHLTMAPQRGMVEAVELPEEGAVPGEAQTSVTLNLGLLSHPSPLPAAFLALLTDPSAQGPLLELLGMLDEPLIAQRLEGLLPERALGASPRFAVVQRELLTLRSFRTPGALHGLFQQVFPELEVSVRRALVPRWTRASTVCLGRAALGSAALGGEALVAVRGIEITLRAEAQRSPAGARWGREIERRLREQVFPLLGATGLHLVVALLLLDPESRARLRFAGPFDAQSALGFDRLGRAPIRFHRWLYQPGWGLRRARPRRRWLHPRLAVGREMLKRPSRARDADDEEDGGRGGARARVGARPPGQAAPRKAQRAPHRVVLFSGPVPLPHGTGEWAGEEPPEAPRDEEGRRRGR